jgi:anti-sigma factor RsiW
MECRDARALLDAYLDGEFGVERSLELERHLESCPDCSEVLAARRALSRSLKEKLPYHAAPLAVHRAARDALAREDAASGAAPTARRAPPAWLRMAASLLLVAGLSSALTYSLVPRDAGLVPDEVFASHVRGMLSEGRMIDVASSDEHTVKPWFNNKLDFAPPVKDLTAEGFPLLGGRVDYIGGRRVAALLFRHRQHVITLFIWPNTGGARAIATSSRRGDSLAHWSDGAMIYWAVSDLNAAELLDFCRRYQRAEPLPEPAKKQP